MRNWILLTTFVITFMLPGQSQINQAEFWAQVDEQMRQQEQQRWANEQTEMARAAEQQLMEQQSWDEPEPANDEPDPMSIWLTQAGAMACVAQDLMLDPKYQRFRDGFWEFHSVNGQYRSAMFTNPNGVISLHGPGGTYNGALLLLWGPNIPAPKALTMVSVTLQQDELPPATVKTFNLGFPNVDGWGTLIFAVPSNQALLDNMSDVQKFTATIDGKVVFNSTWHDGLAARAKLAE